MISEAIDYYHDLLSGKYLESTVDILESAQERLVVAGRPVCNVLRPYFTEAYTYARVQRVSVLLMQAISTLCRHLLSNDDLLKQMDLSEEEEYLIRMETGYGAPDVSARLDAFLDDQSFAFVEYNADSPGGIGYGDALAQVFASMPLVNVFSERYSFRTIPVRSLVFESLLEAYRRWGGRGLPAIAIIDWKETPTRPEFQLFAEMFERCGCPVAIGDPRDLEYTNGKLYLRDFRIDLVYKRLVVGEMIERLGIDNSLVQAARDRAVCVANGFGVQLAFRKGLFALLSDPVNSRLFTEEMLEAIRYHIPWTRSVRDVRTTHKGQEIELLPYIRKNRERFVLKPSGDYGGRGIVLGWEAGAQEWENGIHQALKSSYVVQERIRIGKELYPSFEAGQLVFSERYFDLDPYVWNGEKVEGCGVRLSRGSLLNVSAGGGSATPMFILL